MEYHASEYIEHSDSMLEVDREVVNVRVVKVSGIVNVEGFMKKSVFVAVVGAGSNAVRAMIA
jgi:hypothetical protein